MTGMTEILGRLTWKKKSSYFNILTVEIVLVQIYFPENSDFYLLLSL